jgi:hypothetical protein
MFSVISGLPGSTAGFKEPKVSLPDLTEEGRKWLMY